MPMERLLASQESLRPNIPHEPRPSPPRPSPPLLASPPEPPPPPRANPAPPAAPVAASVYDMSASPPRWGCRGLDGLCVIRTYTVHTLQRGTGFRPPPPSNLTPFVARWGIFDDVVRAGPGKPALTGYLIEGSAPVLEAGVSMAQPREATRRHCLCSRAGARPSPGTT